MVFAPSSDGGILWVRVTPGASRDDVSGTMTDEKGQPWLSLRVTAPPEKGRANKAVVALVAKRLGLPKSSVCLIAGEKDRHKRLKLSGDPEKLERAIAALTTNPKGS